MGNSVPSIVRSKLSGLVGHECHLIGLRLENKVEELFRGVALDVEFAAYDGAQGRNIGAAYVTLVGTRMHGDSVCSVKFTIARTLQKVGSVAATRVSDGGNLIYIYT